jgi:hypothetical protein
LFEVVINPDCPAGQEIICSRPAEEPEPDSKCHLHLIQSIQRLANTRVKTLVIDPEPIGTPEQEIGGPLSEAEGELEGCWRQAFSQPPEIAIQ